MARIPDVKTGAGVTGSVAQSTSKVWYYARPKLVFGVEGKFKLKVGLLPDYPTPPPPPPSPTRPTLFSRMITNLDLQFIKQIWRFEL